MIWQVVGFNADGTLLLGLYTPNDIKKMIAEGKIGTFVLARPEGTEAWSLLSDLIESEYKEHAKSVPQKITAPTSAPVKSLYEQLHERGGAKLSFGKGGDLDLEQIKVAEDAFKLASK